MNFFVDTLRGGVFEIQGGTLSFGPPKNIPTKKETQTQEVWLDENALKIMNVIKIDQSSCKIKGYLPNVTLLLWK